MAVLLMIAITEFIIENFNRLEHVSGDLESARKESAFAYEQLRKAIQEQNPALRTWQEAALALSQELKAVEVGDAVIIEHLGLDMVHAWDYVTELLQLATAMKIEYRLLMLDSTAAENAENQVPEDWAAMRRNSNAQLNEIEKYFKAMASKFGRSNREIKFEVKRYKEYSPVHGIRILKPFRFQYVAFLRWDREQPSKLQWGEKSYHLIHEPYSDDTNKDLAEIFNAQFEHLWESIEAPTFRYETPPRAGPAQQIDEA